MILDDLYDKLELLKELEDKLLSLENAREVVSSDLTVETKIGSTLRHLAPILTDNMFIDPIKAMLDNCTVELNTAIGKIHTDLEKLGIKTD